MMSSSGVADYESLVGVDLGRRAKYNAVLRTE
jgi:hypothetical protein